MLLPCSAAAEEPAAEESETTGDRVVLTIGDSSVRSGNRYNENFGLWQ